MVLLVTGRSKPLAVRLAAVAAIAAGGLGV